MYQSMYNTSAFSQFNEMIQKYIDLLYQPFQTDFRKTLSIGFNETYGELHYYSVIKLLKYLDIKTEDHILDIGSGIGRFVIQLWLLSDAKSISGIEINPIRHAIALKVSETIQNQLPKLYDNERKLTLLEGDFLEYEFKDVTIIYVCSTVFSNELLTSLGNKLNTMESVQKIITLRKLPELTHFKLSKKLFLHATWDITACYIYLRRKIAL